MKIYPITGHRTNMLNFKSNNNREPESLKSKRYDNPINNEGNIWGYDGCYMQNSIRQEIKLRIYNGLYEGDRLALQYRNNHSEEALKGKYEILKKATYIDRRSKKIIYVFENIGNTPDDNGVRGKYPLHKKNHPEKVIKIMQDAGIKTLIDLRDEKRCSAEIKDAIAKSEIEYLNFPVQQIVTEKCDEKYCNLMTSLFEKINMGDFFIGCDNGESRTDLVLGINYVCNKYAKNLPELKWLVTSNNDTDLRFYIKKINKFLTNNPEFVKNWGWKDIDEYNKTSYHRLKMIYENN